MCALDLSINEQMKKEDFEDDVNTTEEVENKAKATKAPSRGVRHGPSNAKEGDGNQVWNCRGKHQGPFNEKDEGEGKEGQGEKRSPQQRDLISYFIT